MIKQEIKDKLKLTGEPVWHANSFINGCECFWSELLECWVADYDLNGEPFKDNRLMAFNTQIHKGTKYLHKVEMIESFVLNMDQSVLIKCINNNVNKDMAKSITSDSLQDVVARERHRIAQEYCQKKGWDFEQLTVEQMMEIRKQPEWINPVKSKEQ